MSAAKTKTEAEVILYCDGACSPNPGVGGWGVVLVAPRRDGVRKELSGAERDSPNQRMELTAALEGLRAAVAERGGELRVEGAGHGHYGSRARRRHSSGEERRLPWSRDAHHRRVRRVSHPEGADRGHAPHLRL
ncbi:MAG: hypothetical protein M1457_02645, partial [bacterium]|nr:hypothetical protein [bacterium]